MTNIVLYKDTLNENELTKHRAFIAVKAQALMGRYFQLPQDDLVKRDILLGWMDTLQNFTQDEISDACKSYLKEYPRTRPHEGLIYNLIIREKKKKTPLRRLPVKNTVPDRNLTNEERRRISQEVLGKYAKK